MNLIRATMEVYLFRQFCFVNDGAPLTQNCPSYAICFCMIVVLYLGCWFVSTRRRPKQVLGEVLSFQGQEPFRKKMAHLYSSTHRLCISNLDIAETMGGGGTFFFSKGLSNSRFRDCTLPIELISAFFSVQPIFLYSITF